MAKDTKSTATLDSKLDERTKSRLKHFEAEMARQPSPLVIDTSFPHFSTAQITLSVSDCVAFGQVVEGNVEVHISFRVDDGAKMNVSLDVVMAATLFRCPQPGIWIDQVETWMDDEQREPGGMELRVRVGLTPKVFSCVFAYTTRQDRQFAPLEEQVRISGSRLRPISATNPREGFSANISYCNVGGEIAGLEPEPTVH